MDAETLSSPEDYEREGFIAYQARKYEQAAMLFQKANRLYLSQENDHPAAEMANNESVAWLLAKNARKALECSQGTEAIFEKEGDTRRQAMAIGNQAAALEELNRLDEAEALYKEAAQLLDQVGDTDLKSYVMKSLSGIQIRRGKHLEAVGAYQEALSHKQELSPNEGKISRLLGLIKKLIK